MDTCTHGQFAAVAIAVGEGYAAEAAAHRQVPMLESWDIDDPPWRPVGFLADRCIMQGVQMQYYLKATIAVSPVNATTREQCAQVSWRAMI